MAQPDTDLGIAVDFDNEGFRNAIRFSMQMGRNPDPTMAPKFMRKSGQRTYWLNGAPLGTPPRLDRDGKPLNPQVEVRVTPDEEVLQDGRPIDCAVEVDRADAEELPVGNFRPTKVIVTLLDEQYQLVKDCRELIYNGDRYMYGYEPESVGLFQVGVYTIIYYARDES